MSNLTDIMQDVRRKTAAYRKIATGKTPNVLARKIQANKNLVAYVERVLEGSSLAKISWDGLGELTELLDSLHQDRLVANHLLEAVREEDMQYLRPVGDDQKYRFPVAALDNPEFLETVASVSDGQASLDQIAAAFERELTDDQARHIILHVAKEAADESEPWAEDQAPTEGQLNDGDVVLHDVYGEGVVMNINALYDTCHVQFDMDNSPITLELSNDEITKLGAGRQILAKEARSKTADWDTDEVGRWVANDAVAYEHAMEGNWDEVERVLRTNPYCDVDWDEVDWNEIKADISSTAGRKAACSKEACEGCPECEAETPTAEDRRLLTDTGQGTKTAGAFGDIIQCHQCNGQGMKDGHICSTCGGNGNTPKPSRTANGGFAVGDKVDTSGNPERDEVESGTVTEVLENDEYRVDFGGATETIQGHELKKSSSYKFAAAISNITPLEDGYLVHLSPAKSNVAGASAHVTESPTDRGYNDYHVARVGTMDLAGPVFVGSANDISEIPDSKWDAALQNALRLHGLAKRTFAGEVPSDRILEFISGQPHENGMQTTDTCPACDGTGKMDPDSTIGCMMCRGTGKIDLDETGTTAAAEGELKPGDRVTTPDYGDGTVAEVGSIEDPESGSVYVEWDTPPSLEQHGIYDEYELTKIAIEMPDLPPYRPVETWNCSKCGMTNVGASKRCIECLAPRATTESARILGMNKTADEAFQQGDNVRSRISGDTGFVREIQEQEAPYSVFVAWTDNPGGKDVSGFVGSETNEDPADLELVRRGATAKTACHIRKNDGGKYEVYTDSGVEGTHDTEAEAKDQQAAIEANMHAHGSKTAGQVWVADVDPMHKDMFGDGPVEFERMGNNECSGCGAVSALLTKDDVGYWCTDCAGIVKDSLRPKEGSKTASVSTSDLNGMTSHEDYEGFGYLGHTDRSPETDQMLVDACNQLGLSANDMWLWANSRVARHFMDGALSYGGMTSGQMQVSAEDFKNDISKNIADLRSQEENDGSTRYAKVAQVGEYGRYELTADWLVEDISGDQFFMAGDNLEELREELARKRAEDPEVADQWFIFDTQTSDQITSSRTCDRCSAKPATQQFGDTEAYCDDCADTLKDDRVGKTAANDINTTDYEFSHGKRPTGDGSWAFLPADKTPGDPDYLDHVVWLNGKYNEVKNQLPEGSWKVLGSKTADAVDAPKASPANGHAKMDTINDVDGNFTGLSPQQTPQHTDKDVAEAEKNIKSEYASRHTAEEISADGAEEKDEGAALMENSVNNLKAASVQWPTKIAGMNVQCEECNGTGIANGLTCSFCDGEGYRVDEGDDGGYPDCPICGEPIDYCQGHGTLGKVATDAPMGGENTLTPPATDITAPEPVDVNPEGGQSLSFLQLMD